MPAAEYAGWVDHFGHFPPGDYLLQMLIAQLLAMLDAVFGGKHKNPFDWAPWLETPTKRREKAQEKEKARLMAQAEQIRDAYKRAKEQQGDA